jgi:hypothetical protein
MQTDNFNSIRVDFQDIFNETIALSKFHSRMVEDDMLSEKIVICPDDFGVIFSFANEGAVQIADNANYISVASQTGFEALTAAYTAESPNPHDAKNVRDLMNNEKQTGELLDKGEMDIMDFNVTEMEGINPLKYTITQTYIRSALIHYILYKWFQINKITDAMMLNFSEFEKFKYLIKTNSLNSQKTINTRKAYRPF